MKRTTIATSLLVALTSSAACIGTIGDEDDLPDVETPSNPTELEAPDCADVGPRAVRRLTGRQLQSSLVALFNDAAVPTTEILADPVVHGFQVDATEAVIRDLNAQQLMRQAERIATWAADEKLGELSPCQSHDEACGRQFIEQFGARAYRRAVPGSSADAYLAMFMAESSFADGAEAVISAVLQSPFFLYRTELGEDRGDGRFALTPDELASNIAFTITDAPPDEALRQAAAEGRLTTEEDVRREVQRLLQSPASDGPLAHFVEGWLEIEDLQTRAKEDPTQQYTPAVAAAMGEETRAFFRAAVREGMTFGELLTAEHTYVDPTTLGPYYGMWNLQGDGMQRAELEGTSRARGILGQGAFLARHALADTSSPVQRGVIIRERFLCQELPSPPPTVDANLPETTEPVTTRERYAQHTQDPSCTACHNLIDPIGFTFENYDAYGRHRDQENGTPIDATGSLSLPDGEEVPLDGLDTLSDHLASSERAAGCFQRYASYYAYGLDGCNPEAIVERAGANPTLEDLIVAIVTAPHFMSRRAED